MPIANIALNAAQFNFLQNNITQQVAQVFSADDIALSGLNYVCDLQEDAPEVDLVGPFNDQLTRMDALQSLTNWVSVVSAMNNHIVTRFAGVGIGSTSDQVNAYLAAGGVYPVPITPTPIIVTPTYADLSAIGGVIISPLYIA